MGREADGGKRKEKVNIYTLESSQVITGQGHSQAESDSDMYRNAKM